MEARGGEGGEREKDEEEEEDWGSHEWWLRGLLLLEYSAFFLESSSGRVEKTMALSERWNQKFKPSLGVEWKAMNSEEFVDSI